MPEFTIDGKTYTYEGQQMLLQFCLDNGIEIPYFCYHPAMSIPTNCRMCLVEVGWPVKDRETGKPVVDENGEPKINWGRKPATSCNTPLSPDLVVRTHRSSEEVEKMQKGVLEYMLVNHPLDCPICDQAGECPLQIWTYKYGPEGSRFENQKIHKPKRIELGPNVVLDAERCINCTRCTRFTEEVSGTSQLSIIGRGEKNYPSCAPGQEFDDAYSMNTIDLCPVGALTSKAFRFKARVWEMAYSPGVCNGCSKGCSTDVWVRDNKVLRQTPRENPEVNQFWMCDEGRLAIDQYNEGRLEGVSISETPASYEDGYKAAAEILKKASEEGHLYVLGSAYGSLESNYVLKQLGKRINEKNIFYVPRVEKGWGDDLLRMDDRTPNTAGVELLGFKTLTVQNLKHDIGSGKIKTLLVGEDDRTLEELAGPNGSGLQGVTIISIGQKNNTGHQAAAISFGSATSVESESTFINHAGIPQVTKMAKEIKKMDPEMWLRLPKSRLDKGAVAVDKWRNLDNVFDVLPAWKIYGGISKALGKDLSYKSHKDVFSKMKSELEPVREMNISYKVPKEAFKFTQFDFAVK